MQLRVVKGEAELHSVDIPGFPIRRWYCRICDIRVLHDKLSGDGAVLRKVGKRDERPGSSCCRLLRMLSHLLLRAGVARLQFRCMHQLAPWQTRTEPIGLVLHAEHPSGLRHQQGQGSGPCMGGGIAHLLRRACLRF